MLCDVEGCDLPAVHARLCRDHLTEKLARVPDWKRAPRDDRPALLAQYGLTPDDYARMLLEQDGVCKICRQPEPVPGRALAVDHDHVTLEVRGLLCSSCNRGLGFFRDDRDLLARAIDYLKGNT